MCLSTSMNIAETRNPYGARIRRKSGTVFTEPTVVFPLTKQSFGKQNEAILNYFALHTLVAMASIMIMIIIYQFHANGKYSYVFYRWCSFNSCYEEHFIHKNIYNIMQLHRIVNMSAWLHKESFSFPVFKPLRQVNSVIRRKFSTCVQLAFRLLVRAPVVFHKKVYYMHTRTAVVSIFFHTSQILLQCAAQMELVTNLVYISTVFILFTAGSILDKHTFYFNRRSL